MMICDGDGVGGYDDVHGIDDHYIQYYHVCYCDGTASCWRTECDFSCGVVAEGVGGGMRRLGAACRL